MSNTSGQFPGPEVPPAPIPATAPANPFTTPRRGLIEDRNGHVESSIPAKPRHAVEVDDDPTGASIVTPVSAASASSMPWTPATASSPVHAPTPFTPPAPFTTPQVSAQPATQPTNGHYRPTASLPQAAPPSYPQPFPPHTPAAPPHTPAVPPHTPPVTSFSQPTQHNPQDFAAQAPLPTAAANPASIPSSYSAEALITQLTPETPQVSRRSLRGRLGFGPSAKEVAEQRDEETVRTHFARPVTIMIANPKGGVGKTPTTLMLAAAFGVARGGGVCAWDNNELRGTMPDRSLSPHRRTVRDVLSAQEQLSQPQAQFTDLAYFLNHQTSGKFYTLGSAQNFGHVISQVDFESIHAILTRFFQIVIVDTGNNEASPNWLAAAESADCLVVPTKWRKDSLIPAARMLETLQEKRSELLQRTIVVATNGPMDSQPDVRKMGAQWFGGGQPIVEIPTDPHVAEGGVLEYHKLKSQTQREALRLAAQVSQILGTVAR